MSRHFEQGEIMSTHVEPGTASQPDPTLLEDLARAARDGDATALERLLTLSRPRALRVCQRILPCRADAEDACQEALLLVATKLGSFDGRSRYTSWLHVVAANAARSTYRRLRQVAVQDPDHRVFAGADPRTTSVIAGTRLDLLEALDRLEATSHDLAVAVVLRDLGDLTYAQIAENLGVPEGTIKARVHHGRARLRTMLS
jgi:RNA polymerase sigma-70 factor (ECF subfamily)